TTNASLWDSQATPPALVQPGDRVRYRAVSSLPAADDARSIARHFPAHLPRMEVLDAGLMTVYQDVGRPGYGDLGVTASGAPDRASAATAKSAVGNLRQSTVLSNIGGMVIRALSDTVICVSGATTRVRVGNMPVHLDCT